MRVRIIAILAATLLPALACDPTAALHQAVGAQAAGALAASSDPAAVPPGGGGGGGGGSCTVDNSDPNYTCTTCTTTYTTTITCVPKTKPVKHLW
ncbi:MAG: hypothetical protein K1X88_10725 [Nannocystaceae bacterium]|nr:hypothetical protein [Nannocystaceae bacterium]